MYQYQRIQALVRKHQATIPDEIAFGDAATLFGLDIFHEMKVIAAVLRALGKEKHRVVTQGVAQNIWRSIPHKPCPCPRCKDGTFDAARWITSNYTQAKALVEAVGAARAQKKA